MGQPSEEIRRSIFFTQELDIGLRLVKYGLAHLQNNKLYKQHHFIFMILLTSGIERLAKIVLYLEKYQTEGRYLKNNELKRLGHDIEKLVDLIVERCFTTSYVQRSFAAEDLDFLKNDHSFRSMLKLLARFGKQDRYIYMDGMSDPSTFRESPEMLWEEFQRGTIPKNEWTQLLVENRIEEFVEQMNRNAIIHVEKLLRALARLFVFGILGDEGRRYSSTVREIAKLENETLGKTVYEL